MKPWLLGLIFCLTTGCWSCEAPHGKPHPQNSQAAFPLPELPGGWEVVATSPVGKMGQNGFNRMEAVHLSLTAQGLSLHYLESSQEASGVQIRRKRAKGHWANHPGTVVLDAETIFETESEPKDTFPSGQAVGKLAIREWIPEGKWESYQKLTLGRNKQSEWHTGLSVPASLYTLSEAKLWGDWIWVCLNPQRSVPGNPHCIYVLRCRRP
jgi:hypothetical protein